MESFVGKITNVDVWNRVLQKSEIEDMNENCKYFEGDLFSWVEFLENIHGNVEVLSDDTQKIRIEGASSHY